MRKSGSCPNLQTAAPLSPIKYTMKKCGSTQAIVSKAAIEQVFPQALEVQHEITRSASVSASSDYMTMAMHMAPAHVVGICMMEYPEAEPGVSSDDRDKNLAACIASPCEAEESCPVMNVDGVRRYAYMMANENRAGELFSRIRKSKRDQKG